ncbi:MAG: glycosyltransferase family 39 protein [Bryobacterales bacterium]|nr:glycosyltransferase family 39 protein [Bryobacterales bacterium]
MRRALLWGACGFFFLAGLAFVPLPGIQNDEALFSAPLYESAYEYRVLIVFHRKISLLLMSYLGALKTWIYWLVFNIARPSVWSVRLPMLIAGTLTVWLFWRLAERLGGTRAAVIGTLLLATDAMFVLTTVLDWGPVALQHLFLVAAMVLALRFHDTGSRVALFGTFLLLGLAVWDKALFLWLLGGLVVAALIVVPGELRRAFSWRRASLAVVAFCLGAWPVIYHNLMSSGETVRSNAAFTLSELGSKALALERTLAGKALFGYVVGEGWFDLPRLPKTGLQRISVWVSELAGEPRTSVFPWIVLLAALCVPHVWHTRARRPAVFSIILLLVAWFQMAVTQRAGASVHHVVLLWPIPHLLVALVFAELSRRFGRAGVVAVTLAAVLTWGSSFLILNQYHSQLVRYGAPSVWSDAIFTLSDRLPQIRADHIFMMDWGMIDNVRMLTRGRLPIHVGMEAVDKDRPDPALFKRMIELPNSVFVSFTERWEQTEGVSRRLAALTAQLGYRIQSVELIRDRNGRPVFQIDRIAVDRVPAAVQ